MKPAGFPKAWPTKPRSVSPWPGLAGLKACRLSAGRPGRLRTLIGPGVVSLSPCTGVEQKDRVVSRGDCFAYWG